MTENQLPEKIQFLQFHKPAPTFKDGIYRITVEQTLQVPGHPIPPPQPVSKTFAIRGEHYTVKPADVQAVFPPDGSLGDHSNVLPHIILKRSTLPWEQGASPDDEDAPWLTLLLFDETEKVETQVVTLKELSSFTEFAGFKLAIGQSDDDRVALIGVEPEVLEKILPSAAELKLMAHVRQGVNGDQPVGEELAVIIGNRLPRSGRVSTVHLVSVESRYKNGAFDLEASTNRDGLVRLISLKSWRFVCADQGQGFKGLLAGLDHTPGTLRLPARENPLVDPYLARGYVALPHRMRRGDRTVSWCHGPLSPIKSPPDPCVDGGTPPPGLPTMAADALLRFNAENGLFDTSYAAAWELGRALALRSRKFSVGLYNWKQAHRQHQHATRARRDSHLPSLKPPQPPSDQQLTTIEDWFKSLNRLEGVPFNYLVPDERLLPPESIRYFHLDPHWLSCLLDGALSIGRVTRADHRYEFENLAHYACNCYPGASGFLLRSAVVAGWPEMLIEAYDVPIALDEIHPQHLPLTTIRRERLSENVLFCLFDGDVQTVDVHLKPETLHFGLDRRVDDTEGTEGYEKQLRDAQGDQKAGAVVPVEWKQVGAQAVPGVVDVEGLAEQIKTASVFVDGDLTSAQFALEMVEGVDKVRFQRVG